MKDIEDSRRPLNQNHDRCLSLISLSITKYHRLKNFTKNLYSTHSSESWKFKIGNVSDEAGENSLPDISGEADSSYKPMVSHNYMLYA
jgi:hypothetical protein